MSTDNTLEGLKHLIDVVNDTDCKIWENNAHHLALTAETQKLIDQTKEMKSAITEIEKEDLIIETQLQQVESSIQIQHESIEVSQHNIINQKLLINSLLKENKDLNIRFSKNLSEFRKLYDEKRIRYENSSTLFKHLQDYETKVAVLKTKNMWLDQQILNYQQIHRQFHEIQKLKFQQTIVDFAQLYVDHKTAEQVKKSLCILKEKEKELLMEHMALHDEVKKRNTLNKMSNKRQISTANSKITSSSPAKQLRQEKDENTNEGIRTLSQFFPKTLQEFMKKDLVKSSQVKSLNEETNKVRILDMKILDAKTFETVFDKPNDKRDNIKISQKKASLLPQEVFSKYFTSKGIISSQEKKLSQKSALLSQDRLPISQSSILKRSLATANQGTSSSLTKQVTFKENNSKTEGFVPTFMKEPLSPNQKSSSNKGSQIVALPVESSGPMFKFSSQENSRQNKSEESGFEFPKLTGSQILEPQTGTQGFADDSNIKSSSEMPDISAEFNVLGVTTGTSDYASPQDINFIEENDAFLSLVDQPPPMGQTQSEPQPFGFSFGKPNNFFNMF